MTWTGTSDPYDRTPELRRQQISEWCKGWTIALAQEAGGLTMCQHRMIYLMMHEIRRRVLADDLGPPLKVPPAPAPDLLAAVERIVPIDAPMPIAGIYHHEGLTVDVDKGTMIIKPGSLAHRLFADCNETAPGAGQERA